MRKLVRKRFHRQILVDFDGGWLVVPVEIVWRHSQAEFGVFCCFVVSEGGTSGFRSHSSDPRSLQCTYATFLRLVPLIRCRGLSRRRMLHGPRFSPGIVE